MVDRVYVAARSIEIKKYMFLILLALKQRNHLKILEFLWNSVDWTRSLPKDVNLKYENTYWTNYGNASEEIISLIENK